MLALEDGDPGSIGDVRATLPQISDIVAMEEGTCTKINHRGRRDRCGRCLGFARGCLGGAGRFKHRTLMLAETLCLIEFRDTGRPQSAN